MREDICGSAQTHQFLETRGGVVGARNGRLQFAKKRHADRPVWRQDLINYSTAHGEIWREAHEIGIKHKFFTVLTNTDIKYAVFVYGAHELNTRTFAM